MEFKHEEFIKREIEIALYLLQENTLDEIALKTGISRKHVTAHIQNMITKSKVKNLEALKQLLKSFEKK